MRNPYHQCQQRSSYKWRHIQTRMQERSQLPPSPREGKNLYGLFIYINIDTGASAVAQWVKNLPAIQETQVQSLFRAVSSCSLLPSTASLLAQNCKESACDASDVGSIPGSGRSPGGGHGNPLQHSCLENPVDREAWHSQSMGFQKVGHDLPAKHNKSKAVPFGGGGSSG